MDRFSDEYVWCLVTFHNLLWLSIICILLVGILDPGYYLTYFL